MAEPDRSPIINELRACTTRHRRRVWQHALLVTGVWPSWLGVVLCVCIAGTAQFTMVAQRELWMLIGLMVVGISWCGVFWWQRRHAPSIWQELDRHYAWAHSTTTAADFADKHTTHPFAITQFQQTLTRVAATPAHALYIWQRHAVMGWIVCVLAGVATLVMPTPFDAMIANQVHTRALAQTIAQRVAELPPVDAQLDAQQLADTLQHATDAQQLVAQLDVATQQMTQTQQQLQQYASAADQLARAPDHASADAIMAASNQLSTAQQDALRTAYAQAQSGNPEAFNTLQADITRQQQAADQWQRALAAATQQAMQAANASPTASKNAPASSQPAPPQSGNSANQPSDGATANTTTGNGTTPANGNAGAGQSGGDNTASGGAGMGNAPANFPPAVSVFVPQVDANNVVTLTSPDSAANGESTLVNGGGLAAPAAQYAYTEIVAQAAQQAAHAISDAQIPWDSQQVVREYFAALQE